GNRPVGRSQFDGRPDQRAGFVCGDAVLRATPLHARPLHTRPADSDSSEYQVLIRISIPAATDHYHRDGSQDRQSGGCQSVPREYRAVRTRIRLLERHAVQFMSKLITLALSLTTVCAVLTAGGKKGEDNPGEGGLPRCFVGVAR